MSAMDTASEDSGGPSRRWAAIRDALIDHPDVERKQILMMARQIRVDAITRVVFGGFISLSIGLPSMLGTEASSAEATTWFAMFVVLSPVMFLTGQSLLWRDPATFPLRYWRLVFFVLYGANGILWSLLLLFGWTDGSVATQAFVLIVIVAHLTTYLVNLGAHLLTFITTSITVTVFCEILLWHQGSELATITRIIFPMFGIYLLVLGYDANRRLGVSLRRGMELECLADELEIARAAAVAEGRARSRFFASMSHELRTPLNAIIGFSEVMTLGTMGPLEGRYREYAEDILKSGRHLLGLVNQVLDVSSIGERDPELTLSRFRISDVLDDCLAMVLPLSRAKGLTAGVDIQQDFEIEADAQKFKQIVVNLLSNAIKFTPEDGAISGALRANADGDIEVAVIDSGIGMTDEVRSQVFDPYFRSADPYVLSSEGTGLGLAISREVANQLGFTLELQSAPGEGTIAILLVPAKRGRKVARKTADDRAGPDAGPGTGNGNATR